jgi:hypothetical protein
MHTPMTRMQVIILSLTTMAALIYSGLAEAESCSDRKARCYSINYAEGLQRCDSYFKACLSTGVWSSRRGTTTGLTKK